MSELTDFSSPPRGTVSDPAFHGSNRRSPERLSVVPKHTALAVAALGLEPGAQYPKFLTPQQRPCLPPWENPAAVSCGSEGSRPFTHPGSRPPSRPAAHAGGRRGPGRKRSPAATPAPWSSRLVGRGPSGRSPPAPPAAPPAAPPLPARGRSRSAAGLGPRAPGEAGSLSRPQFPHP